jgi:multidrug efflux pump subunit AcrB
LEAAQNLPVSFRDGKAILLRNIASVKEGTTVGQYERYNMQRMVTVTANIADTDLGSVTKQVAQAPRRRGRSAAESQRRLARPGRADATDVRWPANGLAARGGRHLPSAHGEF